MPLCGMTERAIAKRLRGEPRLRRRGPKTGPAERQSKQKSARFRALCAFAFFAKKDIQKVSSALGSRVIRRRTASAGLMPWLTTAFTVCTMGMSTW